MEKQGPDIHSVLSPSPTITSTFQVSIQRFPAQVLESKACGLGWHFKAELLDSTGIYRRLKIFFIAGLLNMRVAKKVHVDVEISDYSPQEPREPTSIELSSLRLSSTRATESYRLGTWRVPSTMPITLSFSVSLPNTTMPTPIAFSASPPEPSLSRPMLQETLHKALQGTTNFADVRFVLYSRRKKDGRVGGQRVLHGNSQLLRGHNGYIDALLKSEPIQVPGATTASVVCLSEEFITAEMYGYDSDSDLGSEWDQDESSATRTLGDVDDVDSSSLSSLSTEEQDNVPISIDKEKEMELSNAARSRSIFDASRVVHISDTSAKTWESLLYYLYTGEIKFQWLSSSDQPSCSSPWACSPKAMYRLADKVGMDDLKAMCKEQIKKSLDEHNIVTEIMSLLTSRYEEIKNMQVDLLLNSFLWSPETRADLDAFMKSALLGEKAHAHGVLSLILNRQSISCARQSSKFQEYPAEPGPQVPLHTVESSGEDATPDGSSKTADYIDDCDSTGRKTGKGKGKGKGGGRNKKRNPSL